MRQAAALAAALASVMAISIAAGADDGSCGWSAASGAPDGDTRYMEAAPGVRAAAAAELYAEVARLPVFAPHTHVDPQLLAEDRPWRSATALLLTPDHYIVRSSALPTASLTCTVSRKCRKRDRAGQRQRQERRAKEEITTFHSVADAR